MTIKDHMRELAKKAEKTPKALSNLMLNSRRPIYQKAKKCSRCYALHYPICRTSSVGKEPEQNLTRETRKAAKKNCHKSVQRIPQDINGGCTNHCGNNTNIFID